MVPIVYRDGMLVTAAGHKWPEVRYTVSRSGDAQSSALVLSQSEAHELARALAWIISEVDAKHGRSSFRTHER